MDKIMQALPAAWRPYAKTVVTVVGALATAALLIFPNQPIVASVVGALTVLGVYAVPNDTVMTGDQDGPLTDEVEHVDETPEG